MTSDPIKKVVQFTTGHGPFGGHLEHWTEANPRCKLCRKGIEMPWHWHMECEGIQFGRSKITVKSILELSHTEKVEECVEKNLKLVMGSGPSNVGS